MFHDEVKEFFSADDFVVVEFEVDNVSMTQFADDFQLTIPESNASWFRTAWLLHRTLSHE